MGGPSAGSGQVLFLHFNLDTDSGGKVEVLERVDGLVCRADDIDEALVSQNLEVLTGVFVGVGTNRHHDGFLLGGQRHRTNHGGSSGKSSPDDLVGSLINDSMIKRFELDADAWLGGHMPLFIRELR